MNTFDIEPGIAPDIQPIGDRLTFLSELSNEKVWPVPLTNIFTNRIDYARIHAMTDPSSGSTVLVVEDKEELAETFEAWLATDHDVRTALTGHDALNKVDEGVDVVLLDRRLPDLNGREVLDRIRSRGLECRVCMVTAVQPDFDILDMGFDDYAVKPVFQDDLLDIIDSLTTRSTYDEQMRDLYSIASKISMLEANKSQEELEESEEYKKLKAEFDDLRSASDSTRERLTADQDYEAIFRAI